MPDTIKIFCRLRPPVLNNERNTNNRSKRAVADPHIDFDIKANDEQQSSAGRNALLSFRVPPASTSDYVNNSPNGFTFRFNHIFSPEATQTDVFDACARPIVESCLQGYNGCLFAYGQTGSGKTYTMTGGAESYSARGIIPRTLQHVFDVGSRTTASGSGSDKQSSANISVSYIEIYKEQGYDLLNPSHRATRLEDLPRIQLLEDAQQCTHLKNVVVHPVHSEKEALDMLFMGDMNRAIAETPLNEASTRSHCIFTLLVSTRRFDSAAIRQSKLHLVDLAGSERVHKSRVAGRILQEAKYINLSLHHLEQVIIALSDGCGTQQHHVPYRNSMMTSLLRDSIGGNCMTAMIATLSLQCRDFGESMSTARFAQRVAMVKNEAVVNEILDPYLMIGRLQKELEQVRSDLKEARGIDRSVSSEMDGQEATSLERLVDDYIESEADELNCGVDWRRIQHCFRIMRARRKSSSPPPISDTDLDRLKAMIRQRDSEISVLVEMLKKEKRRADSMLHLDESTSARSASSSEVSSSAGGLQRRMDRRNVCATAPPHERLKSAAEQHAWSSYQREHPLTERLKELKQQLRQRAAEARSLGLKLSECRARALERQQQRSSGDDDASGDAATERSRSERLAADLQHTRSRAVFERLQRCRAEVEHLERQLEQARAKQHSDFTTWWEAQTAQREEPSEESNAPSRRRRGSSSQLPTPVAPIDATTVSDESEQLYCAGVPLTGDPEADEQIVAFLRARRAES